MKSDKIIKEFNLKIFGSKGWRRGDLFCPQCGKNDKFGVIFTKDGGVCRCLRCPLSLPLNKLLKDLGRKDLIDFEAEFEDKGFLPNLVDDFKEDIKEVKKPIAFKPIFFDEYLHSRGFIETDYNKFNVGISDLDPKTIDKIIFLIFQRGKLSGWLARSRYSKEWHKKNLEKYKAGEGLFVLRYCNSENDFSKLLGGLDEIKDSTKTVILVEGIMDKANVDRQLGLDFSNEVKCCFTFGDNISDDQVFLLPNTVENIFLMYDSDALRNMKDSGARLDSLFNVFISSINEIGIDPGDMDKDKLLSVLDGSISFIDFYRKLIFNFNGKAY